MAKVDTQTRTLQLDGETIEYTVSNERDDGQDLGYYGTHDAGQDGHYYGITGPWPTADEAARRYEQQIRRKRGGRTA